jgi:hypothetical protein
LDGDSIPGFQDHLPGVFCSLKILLQIDRRGRDGGAALQPIYLSLNEANKGLRVGVIVQSQLDLDNACVSAESGVLENLLETLDGGGTVADANMGEE